jgi:hypothetical protein
MFRLLTLVFYFGALTPVLFNLESFKGFPWNADTSLESNLEPYLMLVISFFVFRQMRMVLEPMVKADSHYAECTSQMRGFVRNIGYSDTRVNNSPRFKALVFYSGIEKEFDLLPEAFQFNFEIGDEVVIRHHPDDEENSMLDFDLSLDMKHSLNESSQ